MLVSLLASIGAAADEASIALSDAARTALDAGAYGEAIGHYDRLLQDPTTLSEGQRAAAYHNRGLAHQARGDLAAALADYSASLAVDPADAMTYYNRALVHAELGKTEDALADYTAAIERAPDDARLFYNRANLLFDAGRLGPALADYTRTIRLAPDHADAYANRGAVYAELGALVQAIADTRTALILAPEMRELAGRLRDLEDAAARANRAEPIVLTGRTAAPIGSGFDSFEWRYPDNAGAEAAGLTVAHGAAQEAMSGVARGDDWSGRITMAMQELIRTTLLPAILPR